MKLKTCLLALSIAAVSGQTLALQQTYSLDTKKATQTESVNASVRFSAGQELGVYFGTDIVERHDRIVKGDLIFFGELVNRGNDIQENGSMIVFDSVGGEIDTAKRTLTLKDGVSGVNTLTVQIQQPEGYEYTDAVTDAIGYKWTKALSAGTSSPRIMLVAPDTQTVKPGTYTARASAYLITD